MVCENGNPLRIGEEWQRCDSSNDCPSSHFCSGSHKVCCPTARIDTSSINIYSVWLISESLCTQPKRLGDCTSSVRRYWYNAATRTCELFQYTGCQGNDNNFATLLACQQKCKGIFGRNKNTRIILKSKFLVEPKCPHGRAFKDRNGLFQQCSDKQNGLKCPINYVCTSDGVTHGCCPTKCKAITIFQDTYLF